MGSSFQFREIDDLSPSDFEQFVADTLDAAGWSNIVRTRPGREFAHGDGGVDLFAVKGDRRFAIQVKQRSKETRVDISALNQIVTGAKLAGVDHQILVTNSDYTSEVRMRALRLGVELINRDSLKTLWEEKRSEIGRRIRPRKYQQAVIDDILIAIAQDKRRFLIEMATGLGKTYTAAYLVHEYFAKKMNPKNRRILFLAHQVELLIQAVTAFKNVLGVGDYSYSACFDGAEPENTDFVFASFDTILSHLPRLAEQEFDIIIIDEAHHAAATTYSTVINHFQPGLLIGLTATPVRADNRDVLSIFGGREGHVGKYDLAWALRHNKLAFPKYTVLLDDLNQKKIDELNLGLSISDIDRQLFLHKKDSEVIRIILDTILQKKIENPKAIVFCRSIQHMKHVIQFFPPGSATLVHSEMNDMHRRENIRAFREGDYRFVLVCDLFNEGVDIPETNLLVFLRHTSSRTVWLQQLGRGLRKTTTKEYVHVLDFVGSLERLYEVQKLVEQASRVPIDPEEREQRPNEKHHDNSINVSYNQSAAQILELIENLKYRLNTRTALIDKLQDYEEINHAIPKIESIEQNLTGVSCDQIATHFDSYNKFIDVALGSDYPRPLFISATVEYVNSFRKSHGLFPTTRAVSVALRHNGLLLFTEKEAEMFVSSAKASLSQNLDPIASGGEDAQMQKADDTNEATNQLILSLADKVKSISDLRSIPEEEHKRIMQRFRSEFLFLKHLADYRTQKIRSRKHESKK